MKQGQMIDYEGRPAIVAEVDDQGRAHLCVFTRFGVKLAAIETAEPATPAPAPAETPTPAPSAEAPKPKGRTKA